MGVTMSDIKKTMRLQKPEERFFSPPNAKAFKEEFSSRRLRGWRSDKDPEAIPFNSENKQKVS